MNNFDFTEQDFLNFKQQQFDGTLDTSDERTQFFMHLDDTFKTSFIINAKQP